MRSYSGSAKQVPATWLQRILNDNSEPPRLYAWTLANLPPSPPPPNGTQNQHADASSSLGVNSEFRKDAEQQQQQHRIYILGIGNMGRLYASLLAKTTTTNPRPPPITLVVHRRELLEHWRARPGIELARDGTAEWNADFDIEWWTDAKPAHGPVREPGGAGESEGGSGGSIKNLIVSTKAADALPQVDRLRRYLGGESTVAFTQNGMCKLWPPLGAAYAEKRFLAGGVPRWLVCVTTHGVTSSGAFRSVLASPANVLVGSVEAATPASDRGGDFLAEAIVAAPGLAATRVSTRELWVAQLEKLVVNSVINPLTAVLRCRNGELFTERDGDWLPDVIDLLVEEASGTLRALVGHSSSEGVLLGEGDKDEGSTQRLQAVREELLQRFSFPRLRAMLYGVGAKVAENTSSMLQDVRAGKKTEIEDFNGWLVETAALVGHDGGLPAHEKLMALVIDGKLSVTDFWRLLELSEGCLTFPPAIVYFPHV
ncbi:hypothetical protein M426DRAFT_71880 [Hypoxylon sp. CI-4A]|nr:hypothetical protein M426DRAFT_71880 [Hypoxylon sp. CI-4A]